MTDLQEIEVTIEEAKEAVELAEALEKLERSAAFKKLILKKYIADKPKTLTALFASPDERQRKAAELGMTGVAQLEMFFHQVHMQGQHAKNALEQLEQTKQDLVNEE